MTQMNEEEMAQALVQIQQNQLQGRALHHALHEFGRHFFFPARAEVERFLTDPDPDLRDIALEVLANHWRLPEMWETARQFLEHDEDSDCRMKGASALAVLKRNTQDRQTLSILAHVVRNTQEEHLVRRVAYAAMRGILHYEPREQYHFTSHHSSLMKEIDWKMVDSYL